MYIIDKALQKRQDENNPIQIAVIGAGEMGKGIINQVTKYSPGIRVAVTYNRTVPKAIKAYEEIGLPFRVTESVQDLNSAISSGTSAITDNIDAICEADGLDLIIEVTGMIEFASTH